MGKNYEKEQLTLEKKKNYDKLNNSKELGVPKSIVKQWLNIDNM